MNIDMRTFAVLTEADIVLEKVNARQPVTMALFAVVIVLGVGFLWLFRRMTRPRRRVFRERF